MPYTVLTVCRGYNQLKLATFTAICCQLETSHLWKAKTLGRCSVCHRQVSFLKHTKRPLKFSPRSIEATLFTLVPIKYLNASSDVLPEILYSGCILSVCETFHHARHGLWTSDLFPPVCVYLLIQTIDSMEDGWSYHDATLWLVKSCSKASMSLFAVTFFWVLKPSAHQEAFKKSGERVFST